MSLLGNLSEPITRDDLLKLGWERISKNTLTTQIYINPYTSFDKTEILIFEKDDPKKCCIVILNNLIL